MTKKVIVVGAGIAGLAAGIYALQSGFDATIIESHSIPGGTCTSWRRKGYLFEGAIHWLTGSSIGHPIHRLWVETGALGPDVPVYNPDPYSSVWWEGQTISLYRDIEKLRSHLLGVSPKDKTAIDQLCRDVKRYSAMPMPVQDEKGVKLARKGWGTSLMDMGKMLPAFATMGKDVKTSLKDYASRFSHPGIRLLISGAGGSDFPIIGLLFMMGLMARGDGGYPEGGSLPMTRRMADRFTSLGGELVLNTSVRKIIIENGRVTGVLARGEHHPAEAVIIASDTMSAVDSLFDTPPQDTWVQNMKRNTEGTTCTFASFGVRADLKGLPHQISFPLQKPIYCAEEAIPMLGVNNYAEHRGHAPEGCTALTCFFGETDSYDWWRRARENGTYAAEKQKLADSLIATLGEFIPAVKDRLDVVDIATPLTWERYTASWHGSWMTRMRVGAKMVMYPCVLRDMRGVFFAGQRTQPPGGLPGALTSGRRAVQLLCKETDTVFEGVMK